MTGAVVDRSRIDAVSADPQIEQLAEHLVSAGRVVPGLTVDEGGRGRSWWWPLPAVSDRAMIASLLGDGSVASQQHLAEELAEATDRIARSILTNTSVALLPTRPGRRSVPEAWVRSLCSANPMLSAGLNKDRVRELAAEVEAWVATGAPVPGSVRLCLRVLEPPAAETGLTDTPSDGLEPPNERWEVEILVQDAVDSALMAPVAEVFGEASPFGPDALAEALKSLVTAVRIAPALRPVLDQSIPTGVSLESDELVALVRDHLIALAEAGVPTLLPRWWATGARVGLKAKSSSSGAGADSVTGAGFGFDQLVTFSWAAALGDEDLTEAECAAIAQAAATKRHLVRVRGQWVQVNPAEIEAVMARVGTTGEASAGELIRAGLGLHDLDAGGADVVAVEAEGWIGDLLDNALLDNALLDNALGGVEPVAAPPGFAGELREYQQRGVGWLGFLGQLGLGACLADDMGLGKTAQLIGNVLEDRLEEPTLVVCPVSVIGNWQRELNRFAPELSVLIHHGLDRCRNNPEEFAAQANANDVILTTFSLLDRDLDQLGAFPWGRIVLDEAQQIKNASTKAARAARSLTAGRRVALTGTPIENRLSELWSIMQFLNPGLLGSAASFRQRFAKPIEVDQDEDAAAQLARITTPFILRRLKSDRSIITDLPDKIETVDHCPLTTEQVSLYQSVVDDLVETASKAEGIQRRGLVLAGITKLKQVCNHPAHFLGDGSALPGRSGKLRRTEELLEEIVGAGEKTLCFTQYTAWGERLAPYLASRLGVSSLWLHGGLPRPKRDEMIEAFSNSEEPAVLVLSLKAGGTGLNLVAASHVIHFDRWWNPAVEDQATDRAYRIGQDQTVHVHKLVSAGSIEERIDAMISSKRDLADRVVGTGEAWLTELDTAELADVIALSAAEA